MRIRRKPWARPELKLCPFFIDDAPIMLGKWNANFVRSSQLVVELGCGKGGFIANLAARNPDTNYIAIDIKSEVLALAKRNIEKEFEAAQRKEIDNILSTSWDIARIDMIIDSCDPVSEIYINFPNPWPKNQYKKKRLTHPRQLKKYRDFMRDDAMIFFKTDDDELFNDSINYFKQSGFYLEQISENYYENGATNDTVLTEHEEFFISKGMPVHFIKARKIKLD